MKYSENYTIISAEIADDLGCECCAYGRHLGDYIFKCLAAFKPTDIPIGEPCPEILDESNPFD